MVMAGLSSVLSCAADPTVVDSDPATGFTLYRSGRLSEKDLAELCRSGLAELVVMDGSAAAHECRWRDAVCPGLRIRYDIAQDPRAPVSQNFLKAFDDWIAASRATGNQIAVRCRHGWHRTGRLAAYYRMGHQQWSRTAAMTEMLETGEWMSRYPELRDQVVAFEDYLAAGTCGSDPVACPSAGDPVAEGLVVNGGAVGFAPDVCPPMTVPGDGR